eukprot:g7329.t1
MPVQNRGGRAPPCEACFSGRQHIENDRSLRAKAALGNTGSNPCLFALESLDPEMGGAGGGSSVRRRRRRRSGRVALAGALALALAACCPTSAHGFLMTSVRCGRACGFAGAQGLSSPHCPPWGNGGGDGTAAAKGGGDDAVGGRRRQPIAPTMTFSLSSREGTRNGVRLATGPGRRWAADGDGLASLPFQGTLQAVHGGSAEGEAGGGGRGRPDFGAPQKLGSSEVMATLERPAEEEEDVVNLGVPEAERGETGGGFDRHSQGILRGWGLSGWATDMEGRRLGWSNKEWRKFTAGLRQPWTAREHADKQTWASLFKIDTSGVQEVLKAKGSDLAIKTLAKLQTMAGQEDQAEETLLKLIRDPYNLADASWTPDSVAETAEWRRLEVHQKRIKHKHLKDVMALENRSLALSAEFEGTILDYSRMNVSELTMKLLFDLAKRQDLKEKIAAMFNGEKINNTEDRAVLHVALRAHRDDPPIYVDGVNVIRQVHDTLDQVKEFSERVRSGELVGATGKNLINIVAVGIGGSYLGPEFVHEAFKTQEYAGREEAEGYRLRFLSNVDPVDVRRTLYDLDPEETLVVVISKTFTTAETMLNARTARQWLWDTMGKEPEVAMKHMAACASETAADKVTAFGIPEDRLFPLWDWVGGRYSVCSSVGALPLSLKYGFQQFDSFLAGARSMDKHFLHAPFERNIPVLMGLLGVWNISFMGYKTRTILPYAEALLKFPAHIQQLAMESNGKRVTRNGKTVSYDIGQVDFGEPGTNGQHSFFQLLHMGQVCPAEFIGFIESQNPLHIKGEPICSHDELMANFFAQPDALAVGKPSEELRREGCRPDLIPHRTFDGNRPSLSLLVPKVNAYHLGEMLALYEHRTAVEGFMWDINSFDQWGVELGKSLATDIREKMERFRSPAQEAPSGLNPSTYRLMSRYLQQSETLIKKGGNINHRSKVVKKD